MKRNQSREPRLERGCRVFVSTTNVLDPPSNLADRQDAQEQLGVVDLPIPFSDVAITTTTLSKLGELAFGEVIGVKCSFLYPWKRQYKNVEENNRRVILSIRITIVSSE